MIYYYELEKNSGRISATSDVQAVDLARGIAKMKKQRLLIVYTEAETSDGKPFRTVWES